MWLFTDASHASAYQSVIHKRHRCEYATRYTAGASPPLFLFALLSFQFPADRPREKCRPKDGDRSIRVARRREICKLRKRTMDSRAPVFRARGMCYSIPRVFGTRNDTREIFRPHKKRARSRERRRVIKLRRARALTDVVFRARKSRSKLQG